MPQCDDRPLDNLPLDQAISARDPKKAADFSTPRHYGPDKLSESLPLQAHLAAQASASGNVMVRRVLSPISAAVLAYNFIIADNTWERGSGMTNLTAEMANKTAQADKNSKLADQSVSLDGRYRQIGISAVAAAVRYQGTAKNPAYAPAPTRWQDYTGDAAA